MNIIIIVIIVVVVVVIIIIIIAVPRPPAWLLLVALLPQQLNSQAEFETISNKMFLFANLMKKELPLS